MIEIQAMGRFAPAPGGRQSVRGTNIEEWVSSPKNGLNSLLGFLKAHRGTGGGYVFHGGRS
jgi:hypothetical protein